MKYVISKQKVIEYCAKYAMKTECRSQPLRDIFERIVNSLKDGNTSLTAVQKLLMNSVREREITLPKKCVICFYSYLCLMLRGNLLS